MAVACSLVRAGHDRGTFLDHLTAPINQLGQQYRWNTKKPYNKLSDSSYHTKLARSWRLAVAEIAAAPHPANRVEALQVIGEVKSAAATHTWGGRTGLRDREVLANVHDIAQERATASPSVSVREILRRSTQRNAMTVARALTSLVETGWLDSHREKDISLPTTYYLRVPANVSRSYSPTEVFGAATPKHQAVTRRDSARDTVALLHGQRAAEIWAALTDKPAEAADLIAQSGVSKPTVYRWLPRLAAVGLASKSSDGRTVSTDGLADAEQEAAVVTSDRDARIKLDREGWNAWTERHREATERSRAAEAKAKRRSAWKRRTSRG